MIHPVIFLWGHSRSCSTAFFRMMLERGDFTGVHEPFTSIVAQGYAEVGGERAHADAEVLDLLRALAERTPVFVKEVTEFRYAVQDDPRLATMGTHTFIVRRPEQTIASHYAMNPSVSLGEIGYEHEWNLYETLREATGGDPVVVEAEQLLASPAEVVRVYCERTGIPYRPSALSWQAGDRPEWERTVAWHREAAASTGFTSEEGRYSVGAHNNARLAEFCEYHRPYYEKLRARSLAVA